VDWESLHVRLRGPCSPLQSLSALVVEAAILRLHVCEAGVVVGVDVGQVNLGFMAQEVICGTENTITQRKPADAYRCEMCLTNKSDNTLRQVAVPKMTQLNGDLQTAGPGSGAAGSP